MLLQGWHFLYVIVNGRSHPRHGTAHNTVLTFFFVCVLTKDTESSSCGIRGAEDSKKFLRS